MKVEVWSDIMCPFCYIGKRRFEAALEQFPQKDKVEVVYRSFQLDPNAERFPQQDTYEMVAKKYGLSRERAQAMHDNLVQQAKSVGLDFRFENAIPANSLDAHRLIHYAGTLGKREAVVELMFKAYFTNGTHIGKIEQLADVAAEAGIDREAVLAVLRSDKFADEVRAECREASRLGANGVPYYVIDRKYAVSGAQPSDFFLGALQQAWDEAHPLVSLNDSEAGDSCGVDGYCAPGEQKPQ
ncbi:MAG: DsbA family oxidoreductase [Paenibacillaceae bacterium]|nr:DsbA family oxidoreductase [Paenibacillaceae bacterium]